MFTTRRTMHHRRAMGQDCGISAVVGTGVRLIINRIFHSVVSNSCIFNMNSDNSLFIPVCSIISMIFTRFAKFFMIFENISAYLYKFLEIFSIYSTKFPGLLQLCGVHLCQVQLCREEYRRQLLLFDSK